MKNRIKRYFNKLFKVIARPEMAILPANIAFYIILAIIPLLTIIALIVSSFDISINLVTDMIKEIVPGEAGDLIVNVISGKGFDQNVGLFNVIAIAIASNGTYALVNTSNAIYKIKDNDWLRKRISSIFILFMIIILFVFMLIVPVFGENILHLMREAELLAAYANEIIVVFNLLKWPITLFIIYFNIKLIYAISPSKNIKSSETTYGAIFTTACWIFSTAIFKFYITYFARYDIIYGNLSSLIILMVWVYFLSYIFVLGMGINASRYEIEESADSKPESIKVEEAKEKKEEVKEAPKKKTKKTESEKKNNKKREE